MATPLGARIRHARELAGMTQGELATAVGVSQRTVGNWERGENVPRNKLGKLEDVLDVPLRDSPTAPPESPQKNAPLPAAGIDPELLIMLAEADPAALEAVRAVLRASRREGNPHPIHQEPVRARVIRDEHSA